MVTVYTFAFIFFIVIAIPCVGIAWIGWGLLSRLGQYPSKTPAIQLSIVIKLVLLEVVSATLIMLFFQIFR